MAQPATQSSLQHGALGRRHLDAAVVVDVARHTLEIAGADLIDDGRFTGKSRCGQGSIP
ncbi:hypothetical protein D3C72_2480930 [compost metagenome]